MEEAKKKEQLWTKILAACSALNMLVALIPCVHIPRGNYAGSKNAIGLLAKIKLLDEFEGSVPLSTMWALAMVTILFYVASIVVGARVLVAVWKNHNRVVKSRMALIQAGLNLIGGLICMIEVSALMKENCMMVTTLFPILFAIALAVIQFLYGKAAYEHYLATMNGDMSDEEKKKAKHCTICGADYKGKLCPNCGDKVFQAPKITCIDCGYENLASARTCTKCGIPLKGNKK